MGLFSWLFDLVTYPERESINVSRPVGPLVFGAAYSFQIQKLRVALRDVVFPDTDQLKMLDRQLGFSFETPFFEQVPKEYLNEIEKGIRNDLARVARERAKGPDVRFSVSAVGNFDCGSSVRFAVGSDRPLPGLLGGGSLDYGSSFSKPPPSPGEVEYKKLRAEYERIKKEVSRNKSFGRLLMQYVNERCNGHASWCYQRAGVSRQLYSQIISNPEKRVSSRTAMQLAIGLLLNRVEADAFLAAAGYAFSPSSYEDQVFAWCISIESTAFTT